MKYSSQYVFAAPLVRLFVQYAARWPFLFSSGAIFVPVPLHEKKMRERGYNQSHLFVAHFLTAQGSGMCGCWLLERTQHTKPQVECSREERLQNVAQAFRYRGLRLSIYSRIILVDDVATTGSTIEACARVLYNAGARDIWGFVLAKG